MPAADVPPIPILGPGSDWVWAERSRSRAQVVLTVERSGVGTSVVLERCVAGRLGAAYPAHAHDVEIRLAVEDLSAGAELVADLAGAILAADPACRRVVVAASAGDIRSIGALGDAGLQHIVDVDLPGTQLSLLVTEPGWVAAVDIDLEAAH